ncbi:MAG: cohesin domain-containing protein [Candidatus Pacearchaeota archaeon]|nr:cohesin domain-containing protein [Candidatus Pacearchaeota archaeon]
MKFLSKLIFLIIIGFTLPSFAFASVLSFIPQAQDAYEGENLVAEVRLNTEGESVNALNMQIVFPTDILGFVDFSSGGSVFPLPVHGPDYEEKTGTVSFQAGVPNGYRGEGVIGRIFFQAKTPGFAVLRFEESTQVLLNDGAGTPAGLSFFTGEYTILKKPAGLPVLTSEDHPDESVWYSNPFIRMSWEVKEGADYSYLLTRDPSEAPDDVPDEPVGDLKLTTQEDGIFYFRLRECRDGVCGPAVTRRALKDTAPPEFFEVLVGSDWTLYDGKRFLSFSARDAASGIARYEVFEEHVGAWKVAQSPYLLEYQGSESVKVKAVDKAENERVVEIRAERALPVSRLLSFVLFLFLGLLAGGYLVWRKRKQV